MTNHIKFGISLLTLLAMVLFPSLCCATNWDIQVENNFAAATYIEKHFSADSNWTAFCYKPTIAADYHQERGVIARVDFSIPLTTTADEKWYYNEEKYQTNDMSFWGLDTNVELGYIIPVIIDKMDVAVIGAYGYRFERFSRSDPTNTNTIPGLSILDQDYNVQHLDIGAKFFYNANEQLNLDLKALYGFVVYNSVKNSAVGTVVGDGGFLFKTEANVNYNFYANWVFSLGAFFDVLHLEGGDSDNFTWPDSDMYIYGGKTSLKYTF